MTTAKGALISDLRTLLDPVEFARACGLEDVHDWQAGFLRAAGRRILVNACRQSGKSTMVAIKALRLALMKPRALILVLAPGERQSTECYGKLLQAYRDLGRPVPPDAELKLSLTLQNGTRVVSLPGSERTIRGFSGVDLLVIDEAARIDDDLFTAVRPMIAAHRGSVVMLSTPFGKRGVFWRAWQEDPSWRKFCVPATECPRYTPEILEEERRGMMEWEFNQDYMCLFEEDLASLFSQEMVAQMFDRTEKALRL